MGIIGKIAAYDINELPEAFINFLFSSTFQIIMLATIYYGSLVLLAYYIFKLPPPLISSVWLLGCVASAGLVISFPGLFYFDKIPNDFVSVFIAIGLGPFTLPKAFVCYLSFKMNVDVANLRKHDMARMPIYHITTYRSILRKPVSEWNVDDPWMNGIKRNVDIGVPSFKDKCLKKWRLIVRIAKWRVI